MKRLVSESVEVNMKIEVEVMGSSDKNDLYGCSQPPFD